MSISEDAKIHVASSPINGRQYCRNCGQVLIDRTRENNSGEVTEVWFEPGRWVWETQQGLSALRGSLAPGNTLCRTSRENNPCL